MKYQTHSEEILLLINAMQLCLNDPIVDGWVENGERLIVKFKQPVQDLTGQFAYLHAILQGHWIDKKRYQFEIINLDIPLLTSFLMLSRLNTNNLIKLAESGTKYNVFLRPLDLIKATTYEKCFIRTVTDTRNFVFKTIKSEKYTIREISEMTGLTAMTLHNFKKGKDLKLSNFINLIEALGMRLKIDAV